VDQLSASTALFSPLPTPLNRRAGVDEAQIWCLVRGLLAVIV
jgi:hypothetical protein